MKDIITTLALFCSGFVFGSFATLEWLKFIILDIQKELYKNDMDNLIDEVNTHRNDIKILSEKMEKYYQLNGNSNNVDRGSNN